MNISQEIREHLRFLERNGKLTAHDVVTDAKRPESPLHKHFEWDTQKAAEHHWLAQARALIRTVKVNIIVNDIRIRAPHYVRDPQEHGRTQGYTNVAVLQEDPAAAQQALIAECERASSILKRARLIAMAIGLGEQIDSVLMQVGAMRAQLENNQHEQTQ
jgi:hypothetical protein